MAGSDGKPSGSGNSSAAVAPVDTVMTRWRYFGRLVRLLFQLAPRAMAVNAALTFLLGLTPLLTLFALRHLVDTAARAAGNGGAGVGIALGWAVALVVAHGLEGTGWAVGSAIRTRVQEQLKAQIQGRVIAKAQALPLGTFEQAEFYDRLQRIERGLDQRFFSTMAFAYRIWNRIVTLGALLLYVGAAHGSLPVILVVGTGLFLLFRIRLLREKYILEKKQTERERRLRYLSTLMAGRDAAAEVRLFCLRDHLLDSWSRLFRELRDERLALVRREFRLEGASSSGQSLTLGFALLVVVSLVARGALTVGQYAAFVGAVQEFQSHLYGLFWDTALVDNDLRYIRDFFLYLDLPEERATHGQQRPTSGPQTKVPLPSEEGPRAGIVFEGVSFAYPGSDRLALKGIDLRLRPGERIALVGENGAGKTTLAKLLLGLYHPTEGRILVEGSDLREIHPDNWRERTGAVFQDFQQYHLTLRENIAFGNLNRAGDDVAIEHAARLSGADVVAAALPRGLDTQLGKEFDEGMELSLGQWQKIAVARAYLREAEVLVLDEPTAALDARAEVEVYRQFRDASQGKTVLLISHRLGSARLADRIVVLEDGRIVEEGTHTELMQHGGRYARMLGAQAQWYQ